MLPATYVYVFRTDCLALNDLSGVHPLEKNNFFSLSSCYLPVALPLGVEPVRLPSSTLDINCYCLYADLAWKILLRFHGYSSLSRRCLAVNILVLCPLKSFLLPLLQCSLSFNCRRCIPVSEGPPSHYFLSAFWPVVVFCDCIGKRSFFDESWELLCGYKDRYFIWDALGIKLQ